MHVIIIKDFYLAVGAKLIRMSHLQKLVYNFCSQKPTKSVIILVATIVVHQFKNWICVSCVYEYSMICTILFNCVPWILISVSVVFRCVFLLISYKKLRSMENTTRIRSSVIDRRSVSARFFLPVTIFCHFSDHTLLAITIQFFWKLEKKNADFEKKNAQNNAETC